MVELPSIGGMRPGSGRSAQQRVTPLSNATVQSQFNAQREFYRQQYAERRQALVERRRAAAMRQAAERRESAKDRRGSGLLQGADRQSGKKEESTKAEVSTSAEKSGGVVDELGQPAGLMAVPKVSEEKRQALVASKKQEQQSLKEYGEFVDMSGRPISWSDSQKAAAQKAASSGNVLEAAAAQQYLWMDDPDAFLSAANIEKRTSDALKILNIDTSKKSNTGNPVVDFAAEFVKGAAGMVPGTLRVLSAGAFGTLQLSKVPGEKVGGVLGEGAQKWVGTTIDAAIENPAEVLGGVAAGVAAGGAISGGVRGGVRAVTSGLKKPPTTIKVTQSPLISTVKKSQSSFGNLKLERVYSRNFERKREGIQRDIQGKRDVETREYMRNTLKNLEQEGYIELRVDKNTGSLVYQPTTKYGTTRPLQLGAGKKTITRTKTPQGDSLPKDVGARYRAQTIRELLERGEAVVTMDRNGALVVSMPQRTALPAGSVEAFRRVRGTGKQAGRRQERTPRVRNLELDSFRRRKDDSVSLSSSSKKADLTADLVARPQSTTLRLEKYASGKISSRFTKKREGLERDIQGKRDVETREYMRNTLKNLEQEGYIELRVDKNTGSLVYQPTTKYGATRPLQLGAGKKTITRTKTPQGDSLPKDVGARYRAQTVRELLERGEAVVTMDRNGALVVSMPQRTALPAGSVEAFRRVRGTGKQAGRRQERTPRVRNLELDQIRKQKLSSGERKKETIDEIRDIVGVKDANDELVIRSDQLRSKSSGDDVTEIKKKSEEGKKKSLDSENKRRDEKGENTVQVVTGNGNVLMMRTVSGSKNGSKAATKKPATKQKKKSSSGTVKSPKTLKDQKKSKSEKVSTRSGNQKGDIESPERIVPFVVPKQIPGMMSGSLPGIISLDGIRQSMGDEVGSGSKSNQSSGSVSGSTVDTVNQEDSDVVRLPVPRVIPKVKKSVRSKPKKPATPKTKARKTKKRVRISDEDDEKKKKKITIKVKKPYTRKETVNQLPWLEVDKVPPAKPIRLYR